MNLLKRNINQMTTALYVFELAKGRLRGCNLISSPTGVSPNKKSLTFRYLDDASLGQGVPWTMRNVISSPTDVSLTENSWMVDPLHKASLGYLETSKDRRGKGR